MKVQRKPLKMWNSMRIQDNSGVVDSLARFRIGLATLLQDIPLLLASIPATGITGDPYTLVNYLIDGLGGGFKDFIFPSLLGEMIQFD